MLCQTTDFTSRWQVTNKYLKLNPQPCSDICTTCGPASPCYRNRCKNHPSCPHMYYLGGKHRWKVAPADDLWSDPQTDDWTRHYWAATLDRTKSQAEEPVLMFPLFCFHSQVLVNWPGLLAILPPPPHAGYPREGRQVGPCRPMSVGKVAKYFHCRRICLWIQSVRALSIQVHCSHETSGCSSDSGGWVGAGEAGVEERSRVIGCCADIRNTVNVNNSTGPQIEWGQDVTDGWRPPWYKSFSRGVTLLCLHWGTPYNYSLRNSIFNESVLHK